VTAAGPVGVASAGYRWYLGAQVLSLAGWMTIWYLVPLSFAIGCVQCVDLPAGAALTARVNPTDATVMDAGTHPRARRDG